jgi:hypothetical protein
MAKAVDALAHVDEVQGKVNLHAPRKQRHDAHSLVGATASAISTETNIGAATVSSCYQRNRRRAAIPWRRATSDRLASGRIVSSTISRLSHFAECPPVALACRRNDPRRLRRPVGHMTKAITQSMAVRSSMTEGMT